MCSAGNISNPFSREKFMFSECTKKKTRKKIFIGMLSDLSCIELFQQIQSDEREVTV